MQLVKLSDVLDYEQPSKYIVDNTDYNDNYDVPVLTAGKSFILGFTSEKNNIYEASKSNPVIIFDDFTTEFKYVDFPFKVKSSAMKILKPKNKDINLRYIFHCMNNIEFEVDTHKRYWISEYSNIKIKIGDYNYQNNIVKILDNIILKKDLLNQKIDYLNELYSSSFLEYFGNPENNSHNYIVGTLNDVCSSIVRGPFGSSLKKEFFVEKSNDTYKVYEQKNAIQKNNKIGSYYINQTKFNELKRFECKPGDIIMSCSGTMGKLYVLPKDSEKGIINQALCKFTLNDKVSPNYFINYFNMTIDNLDTKGSSIKNIAAVSYVKAMKILIPPIEIQNKYNRIIDLIEDIKNNIYEQINKYSELYNKILKEELKKEVE